VHPLDVVEALLREAAAMLAPHDTVPPAAATRMAGTAAPAVNPHLMRDLQYDPFRDFTPVLAYRRARAVLAARPQLGPRGMQEFVALARTRP
jgi:tripartite-type tricarboxylate transporter receptor subunit TctC